MKRLILMRHAKSDWSDPNASDHERTLNARGRAAAEQMGNWLRAQSLHPDHVLCSDATRTRETLARLALGPVNTTFTRTLYLADADVMAGELRKREEDCILMLGHNPGSAFLAEMLLRSPPDHDDFDRFPTCATLVAAFDVETWSDLRMGTGRAIAFTVPRDLKD